MLRTMIEEFLLVVEKQESVVYFVSETLSYPANYDLLCPSRSSYRETVTTEVVPVRLKQILHRNNTMQVESYDLW